MSLITLNAMTIAHRVELALWPGNDLTFPANFKKLIVFKICGIVG